MSSNWATGGGRSSVTVSQTRSTLINVEVGVDQAVSHGCDLRPGDSSVALTEVFADLGGGLTDDFDRFHETPKKHPVMARSPRDLPCAKEIASWAASRMQVNLATEESGQLQLDSAQTNQSHRVARLELHQNVHVAVVAEVRTEYGAKEGQLRDVMAPAEVGTVRDRR